MTSEGTAISSRRASGSTRPLTTWTLSVPATGSRSISRPPRPTCGTPAHGEDRHRDPEPAWKPNHDPDPEVTAMTLTINDTTMTSDQTAHTARASTRRVRLGSVLAARPAPGPQRRRTRPDQT